MAGQDRQGEGSARGGTRAAKGQDAGVPVAAGATHRVSLDLPAQSPLFHAEHSGRYERQQLIAQYQDQFDCRLIVVSDIIFDDSIVLLEELLYDADMTKKLHMMLDSPGGDGETAVRMV